MELIDDASRRGVPGDFTFDSDFTSAEILNHIESKQRAYVGDLKLNRTWCMTGREQRLEDVVRQNAWAAQKPVVYGLSGNGTSANRCAFQM